MEATGLSLIVLGALSLIAATVGGNLTLPAAKFGPVTSPALRIVLGLLGLALVFGGGVLVVGSRTTPPESPPSVGTTRPTPSVRSVPDPPAAPSDDAVSKVNAACSRHHGAVVAASAAMNSAAQSGDLSQAADSVAMAGRAYDGLARDFTSLEIRLNSGDAYRSLFAELGAYNESLTALERSLRTGAEDAHRDAQLGGPIAASYNAHVAQIGLSDECLIVGDG